MKQLLRSRGIPQATARGVAAGVVATAVMSASMRAAQAMGLLGRMPPRKITDHLLDVLGVKHATPRIARRALATINHVGFGASCGALFGLGHALLGRRARTRPLATTAAGVAFGTLVWAVSYAGWVPALGVMPRPSRDRFGRPATMVVAHWVYGGVLGALVARLGMRGSDGLGLRGSALPKDDREQHENGDGEELALPVLE